MPSDTEISVAQLARLVGAPAAPTIVGVRLDDEAASWSHRGERRTLDTMFDEFGRLSESVARLATIVRGADTDRHDLAPEAADLLAASLGFSRIWRPRTTRRRHGALRRAPSMVPEGGRRDPRPAGRSTARGR